MVEESLRDKKKRNTKWSSVLSLFAPIKKNYITRHPPSLLYFLKENGSSSNKSEEIYINKVSNYNY